MEGGHLFFRRHLIWVRMNTSAKTLAVVAAFATRCNVNIRQHLHFCIVGLADDSVKHDLSLIRVLGSSRRSFRDLQLNFVLAPVCCALAQLLLVATPRDSFAVPQNSPS